MVPMDGIEVLKKIRSNREACVFCLISSLKDDQVIATAQSLEADFIHKDDQLGPNLTEKLKSLQLQSV
jgi:chemotaxis response regulator CheB